MFIATTEATTHELRQEFHVPLTTSLHFTPDGVSGPVHAITINIALPDGGPGLFDMRRTTGDLRETLTHTLFIVRASVGSSIDFSLCR